MDQVAPKPDKNRTAPELLEWTPRKRCLLRACHTCLGPLEELPFHNAALKGRQVSSSAAQLEAVIWLRIFRGSGAAQVGSASISQTTEAPLRLTNIPIVSCVPTGSFEQSSSILQRSPSSLRSRFILPPSGLSLSSQDLCHVCWRRLPSVRARSLLCRRIWSRQWGGDNPRRNSDLTKSVYRPSSDITKTRQLNPIWIKRDITEIGAMLGHPYFTTYSFSSCDGAPHPPQTFSRASSAAAPRSSRTPSASAPHGSN